MSTAKRQMSFRVMVKRNYGAHEISFELGEILDISSGHERQSAFDNLLAQVNDQIKRYEELELPHVKLPMGQASQAPKSHAENVGHEAFLVETIKVEHVEGKRRVRCCGGKFLKHGVTAYPECETNYPIESLDYGTHDVRHLKMLATCEAENGVIKRVRSLK
jgi:hypothetical protein